MKAPAPGLSPCSSCRPCLRLLQPETAQAILSAPLNPQPGTQFFSSDHNLSSIQMKNFPESKNKPEGIAQSPPVKNATRQTYRLGGLVSRLCDSVFRQGLLMIFTFSHQPETAFRLKIRRPVKHDVFVPWDPKAQKGMYIPFWQSIQKNLIFRSVNFLLFLL